MPITLTPAEQRLTTLAQRIDAEFADGRRRLGIPDGWSGTLQVVKVVVGVRHGYVVTTRDGGSGYVLGKTFHEAEARLVEIFDALRSESEEPSA